MNEESMPPAVMIVL